MWLNLTERQFISKWRMSLTVSDLISGTFNQETITIILLVVPLGFSTGTELLNTSAHNSHTDFPMVNLDPPDSVRGRKRGKLLKSRTLSKIVKGHAQNYAGKIFKRQARVLSKQVENSNGWISFHGNYTLGSSGFSFNIRWCSLAEICPLQPSEHQQGQ